MVTSAWATKRSQTTISIGRNWPENLVPLSSSANRAQAATVRAMPVSAARAGEMAGAHPETEDIQSTHFLQKHPRSHGGGGGRQDRPGAGAPCGRHGWRL